jgi:hypothetical protein
VSDWELAVDIGTTATAAAIAVDGDRQSIELDGRSRMPSTVLAPAHGPLVVGEAAEAQAALDPERVERTPKGRLGDPVMLLGGRPVDPVDALAAILGHVGAAAAQRMAGTAPARLVLTHPAPWGSARLDLLRDAARRARLPDPVLVSEPVAAAAHLAHDIAAPGALLAVLQKYQDTVSALDMSGFDTAGLLKITSSAKTPAGKGGAAAGGKIKVSNGTETLLIDPADLAEAERDGFKKVQ